MKPKLPDLKAKEWKKVGERGPRSGREGRQGRGRQDRGEVEGPHTGWLTNGTLLDSSVTRDEPAELPLNRVIKGWQEGVPGMGRRRPPAQDPR